jgi:hypothetical protein
MQMEYAAETQKYFFVDVGRGRNSDWRTATSRLLYKNRRISAVAATAISN